MSSRCKTKLDFRSFSGKPLAALSREPDEDFALPSSFCRRWQRSLKPHPLPLERLVPKPAELELSRIDAPAQRELAIRLLAECKFSKSKPGIGSERSLHGNWLPDVRLLVRPRHESVLEPDAHLDLERTLVGLQTALEQDLSVFR